MSGARTAESGGALAAGTNADLSIDWSPRASVGATCAACGVTGAKGFVAAVRRIDLSDPLRPVREGLELSVYRCPGCGLCSYIPLPELMEYETSYDYDNFTKMYCEAGAGIDFMVSPITGVNRHRALRSVLDVGCGFGFTVDLARGLLGVEAVGVEPSPYGVHGREMLGCRIYTDYVENVAELRGRRFDLVLSSEVIEHVPDPMGFVGLLSRYLSEDGILAMTTPNSGLLAPGGSGVVVAGILSPAVHMHMFSAGAMRALLERCGLVHHLVIEEGDRLIVYASRARLPFSERPAADRGAYLSYLGRLMEGHRASGDECYRGAAFRLFKELVNGGRYEEAEAVLAELRAATVAAYPAGVFEEAYIRGVMGRAELSMRDYGDYVPYYMPQLLLYEGTLTINHRGEPGRAARMLGLAFELTRRSAMMPYGRGSHEWATNLWLCKHREGVAWLLAEEREAAIEAFGAVLGWERWSGDVYIDPPDAGLLAATRVQLGIALLQLGRTSEAAEQFSAAVRMAQGAVGGGTAEVMGRVLAEAKPLLIESVSAMVGGVSAAITDAGEREALRARLAAALGMGS